MLNKSTLAAILSIFAVGAAHATPPQIVRVTDIPYGANDTHVFLLRSLDDNMGVYSRTQTDILLVARNRSTNVDDEIWPVARSIANSPFEDTPAEGRVQAIALDGAVNPFDIMTERGAEANVSGVTLATEGDQLVVTDARDALRYQIGYAEVGQILTDNLNRSRTALPAYFAEGGFDVLQGVTFDPQTDCIFKASANIVGADERRTQLVIVTCANDETIVPIATYFSLPPA
jgi:hypothetical protein